jgi:diguanylate cyclase (GGDEF)-like protein/PAS domain S-box-containing protein
VNTPEHAKLRALRQWAKFSGVLLLCAFAGLMVSAAFSIRQSQSVRAVTAQRIALSRYISRLQVALELITDAETGQRGYLLTGKAFYLEPYRKAVAEEPRILGNLGAMPIADLALAEHIAKIRELDARKLSELAETVRLRDAGDQKTSLSLVQSDVGEHTMQQVRQDTAAALLIVGNARDAIDAALLRETQLGERLELSTLAALLLCGLFAALQMGSLWRAQERYELVLSESERRHRAIVEDQTELISIAAPDGRLEFVNSAYARFFEFSAEDLAGRSLYDHLSSTDRADWTDRMAKVLTTDDALLREQLVPAAGAHRLRWIAWRHRAQHAPGGSLRIHSVGREITLRKRAEEGLRAREDFLVRIGRVAGVGGWSMDLRTGEIYWSPEVRKVHDVSSDYVPDMESALAFYPPRARELMRQAVEAAIEGRIPWDLELPFVSKSGKHKWVRAVGECEFNDEGQATRMVGALQDITQRKAIERSLRELTEVFDNTPDFVAQTDWRGQVHYLNAAARKALGVGLNTSLIGRPFSDFYSPETNDRFVLEIIPAVKEHGVWVGETQVVLEGGRVVPVSHMVIAHRDAVGRVSRYTSLMREITSEVAARKELARKTSTLDAVVEAIPAIVAVWDTDTRYQLVNRAFERWRGRGREDFLGFTIEQATGADEFAQSQSWINRTLAGETVVYEKEYPDRRDYRHMSVTYTPLRLDDGSVGGFIGVAQDITHHQEERLRLVSLSEHDPLTGLLNRAGFESFLIDKVQRGEGARLAVLYIDLDHFKPINDRYGHATGDEVLRQFAARIKSAVRPSDAVARLGGDEFAIVLVGVRDPIHVAGVADKIVEASLLPFEVDKLTLKVSASVGAAYDAELEGGWKGLVSRADAKVYEAKAAGRGRCIVADFEDPARNRSAG